MVEPVYLISCNNFRYFSEVTKIIIYTRSIISAAISARDMEVPKKGLGRSSILLAFLDARTKTTPPGSASACFKHFFI